MEKAYLEKMPIDLLVISHFERPFLEGNHNSQFLTTYEGRLEEKIDENLRNKKLVLITSSAISDPYGLYSGPFLHTLSLSYKHSYLLEPLLRKYKISVYREISEEDNLIIYSIEKKKNPITLLLKI